MTVSSTSRESVATPSWQHRKFTCKNMTRRCQNTCCFHDDLPIAKITQVPLFHLLSAVKPADKRKALETLNERLIKNDEDDGTG